MMIPLWDSLQNIMASLYFHVYTAILNKKTTNMYIWHLKKDPEFL